MAGEEGNWRLAAVAAKIAAPARVLRWWRMGELLEEWEWALTVSRWWRWRRGEGIGRLLGAECVLLVIVMVGLKEGDAVAKVEVMVWNN